MPCFASGPYPCGKCGGCLSKRSSDWAIRLVHENKSHDESSFITLTFEDDSVVDVDKDSCVLFLKRLRKALSPKRIRFYLVSEYGEKNGRPHYHAIIFGHDFRKDKGAQPVRRGLYTSPILEAAWGLGHVSSGEVSDASIRYVSNYILGKQDVPSFMSPESGESRPCAAVFSLMSRNPGIGARWIDEHDLETYRDDNVVVSGFSRVPPRYYDLRAFKSDPSSLQGLRSRRRNDKLRKMSRNFEGWSSTKHPDRVKAAGKIWQSRRAMRQGEL